MKKVVSMALAFFMVFSVSLSVHATESQMDGTQEYFRFKDSAERMSSTGEFEFYCNSNLTSDHFIANSDEITLEATARIYNRNTGKTTSSLFKKFTITVHEVGGSDLEPVLEESLNGSGEPVTINVKQGAEYYLIIKSSSKLSAYLYMDGEGSVSPVTRVN